MPDSSIARPFRIFVSSPGDLGEERIICARVIEGLKSEFARVARLEAILWEQEPLSADTGFQEQIVLPSQTDIVVILIWSRLGYRLSSKFKAAGDAEAPTGTIFEFRDALDGRRRNPAKTPDLMVYRKLAEPPKPSISDRTAYLKTLEDYERVEAFFNSKYFKDAENDGAFTGAYHTFKRGSEFSENFERHIRTMIIRRLGEQTTVRPDQWKGGSPFRGLQAFDFEHRDLFAGRARAAMEVREALRLQATAGRGFVLVMGMSGGGKSSLVRAGVLPDLVQPGVIEGIGLWRRIVLRPAETHGDFFRGLAEALLSGNRELGTGLPELAEDGFDAVALSGQLRRDASAAALIVGGGLRQAADAQRVAERDRLQVLRREREIAGQHDEVAEIDRTLASLKSPQARLAIVIDQLEEVFTDTRFDDAARAAIFATLDALARSGRIWILATLRSDFFARCEAIPELVALKEGNGTYHLLSPNEAEISQMIRHPARAAGLEYESDPRTKESLSDVLLVAATREPGALPLLQFTLDELYKRCESAGRAVLTLADYQALGGLEGALAQRAEEVFASVSKADPQAAAALPFVLGNLVRVAPGDEGAVRATSASASLERLDSTAGARSLVNALVDARLLVSHRGEVRVAHEALLLHWERLRNWIAENTEFLVARGRLSAAVIRWMAEDRSGDFLLPRGKPLVEAEELVARRRDDLSAHEIQFVEASTSARRHEELEVARRRRRVLAAVSSALVLALIFAGVSLWQYRNAKAAAKRATFARDEAEKLIDFMGVDLRKKLAPIGRLELLDSANQRVRAYYDSFLSQGAESDPDIRARQSTALMNQGEILRARGDLAGALKNFREAATIRQLLADGAPGNHIRQNSLAAAEDSIGNILRAQGDLPGALTSYQSGLTRRRRLMEREPAQAEWSRGVAASLSNLGDALTAKGDLPGALKSYREALAIDQQHAAAEPANVEWAHDVWASQVNVGDSLRSQGDLAAALLSFRESLVMIRQLLVAEPKNAFWQGDLAVSLEREADVLAAQDDFASALTRYRESGAIRRTLATLDPTNTDVQRALFVGHTKIGDMLLGQGDSAGALREFADALSIQQRLVDLDPENAIWQRNFGVAYERVGQALLPQKDFAGALKAFEDSLDVRRRLLKKDPTNLEWQHDVFISLTQIGDAIAGRNDLAAALKNYREAIALEEILIAQDASNDDWQRDLAETEDKIGQILESAGNLDESLPPYGRALSTYEMLLGKSPADTSLPALVADVAYHLGRARARQVPPDVAGARIVLERARAVLAAVTNSGGKLTKDQLATREAVDASLVKLLK